MAACMAIATGCDSSRVKEAHKLGSKSATGEANTWRTFSKTFIQADGSGFSEVKRDGKVIAHSEWEAE